MAMQIFTTLLKAVLVWFILAVPLANAYAQQPDTLTHRASSGVKVSGTIIEASTGNPLDGINVTVVDYSSAITDKDGTFSIEVPANTATLLISGEGFQTKEVAIKGRDELAIRLHEADFNSIYKTAYLSYSRKPMSHMVHSVVSVNTPNKFQTSAETPENYMQGKIPGLNMTRRSGTPGIGTFMALRGFNSLNTTNQPLVVVDGMIYDMNDYGGSLITNYFSNPLEQIDIKDIDNITVVKDATSTYGSKGANGAILITTAHAQDLVTKIDFATYVGVNFAPKSLPVMNATDYRIYLSDVLKSGGYSDNYIQSQPYMNDNPGAPDYFRYHNSTQWQDKVFRNSYNKNYYIRVTGGDNIAKYSLSMGYTGHDGIVNNTDFKRYVTRFNADLNISPRLSGNTNLSFTYGEHNLIEEGLTTKTNPVFIGLIKAPFLHTNEISDEGLQSPNLADIDVFNVSNPVQINEKMIARNNSYRFFGSVNFNYKINDHINASSLFGITYDKIRESLFIPKRGVVPDTLYNALALSRMGSQLQRTFSIYNDTRVAYDRVFSAIHTVSARVGMRSINNKSEGDYGLGFNSATDDLQTIGTGTTALRQVGGGMGKWAWLNYYAGLDYSLLGKYFVSLNVAVDGSSRFGDETKDGVTLFNNRFGVFPSVGAGWLVSSENFMSSTNGIEMLKLRASYGLTGNDDIGNYSAKQYYTSQNLLGMQGLVLGNLGNPSLQWETVKKLNVGMDLALLNERVSLSVDVFRNTTANMITYEPVQALGGIDRIITNNGGMKNTGIEVALSGRIIDKELKVDAGLNIAKYKNRVTQLPYDNQTTSYAGATILTSVGRAAAVFYGYKSNGVFATDEEASAYSMPQQNGTYTSFRGGDVRFADLNGDFVIDSNDRTIIGNPNPDFTGMFSTRVAWKRFSLDAAMTFSYGNDVYNYTRSRLEAMKGFENQTLSVANRWRTQGQVTDVPRASWGDPMGNARFSDRWIEDGSYLRLRTVSATYELPVKTEKIKYIIVYITGNNLLTFTRYLGYDPEFSSSNNVLFQGIDTSMTPQFKSVLMGVRIGL
jgi:TonB-linked SusC/RagA family outer membrane protein